MQLCNNALVVVKGWSLMYYNASIYQFLVECFGQQHFTRDIESILQLLRKLGQRIHVLYAHVFMFYSHPLFALSCPGPGLTFCLQHQFISLPLCIKYSGGERLHLKEKSVYICVRVYVEIYMCRV